MKKPFLLCIISLLFAVHIAHAQEDLALRVGYVPLLSQLPLIISYENSRLDVLGPDLTLMKYGSFTSLEAALRVGAIDAASIPVPVALRIAADAYRCAACRIAIIGAIHRGGSRLVSEEQGALETLRGKQIGIPGLDSLEMLLLKNTLTAAGLRFGLDYKLLDVPSQTALQQLRTGKLDAIYLPEPHGSLAEHEQIAFPVDDQQDQLTGTLNTVLVIRSELLASHPSTVQAWMESVTNGCHIIERDIKETEGKQTAILQAPYFEYPKAIVADALVQRKGELSFAYIFPELEELQQILQWASDMKLIMRSIDWNALIAYDFSSNSSNAKQGLE
jgi:ABC-type nitrate/sulfonate/bicarbonate transport system substrate-binding protein